MVRACKRAFLDDKVTECFNAMDVDVGIRKGDEPALVELRAGRLSLAAHPWRLEHDVVSQHRRKPVDVVGVESVCPSLESFAHGHNEPPGWKIAQALAPSIEGRHPSFFCFAPSFFPFRRADTIGRGWRSRASYMPARGGLR